jgi:hypothetical protein
LFSTQAGQRLRGSRDILKTLRSDGAELFRKVGLKNRVPSW